MIFVPSNTWTRYNLHSFLCSSTSCSILCVKTLINILQHHSLYKDVFREVGILEVMVTCLNRYAALFRDSQSEETIQQGEGYILEVWSLVSIDTPHCSGILNQRRPISKVSFIFWRSWSRVSIGTPHCSGILNQKKPFSKVRVIFWRSGHLSQSIRRIVQGFSIRRNHSARWGLYSGGLVTCLNRYAALFRDSQSEETIQQGEGYILEVWSLVSIDTPHCSEILNQKKPFSKVRIGVSYFITLECDLYISTLCNRIEHSTGYIISAIDSKRGY